MILEGRTTVDESMLTGESTPLEREPGGRVLAGSLNYDGAVVCRAESLGEATVLAQIARMVEQAQSSRAPMERLADRASAIFVPVVLGLAALTFVGWLLAVHSLPLALANTVAVLVSRAPAPWDWQSCSADRGRWPRRADGCAVQRRRSAGAAGASGCDCSRQNGNADGGAAGAGESAGHRRSEILRGTQMQILRLRRLLKMRAASLRMTVQWWSEMQVLRLRRLLKMRAAAFRMTVLWMVCCASPRPPRSGRIIRWRTPWWILRGAWIGVAAR